MRHAEEWYDCRGQILLAKQEDQDKELPNILKQSGT